jgi:hypothetical protein
MVSPGSIWTGAPTREKSSDTAPYRYSCTPKPAGEAPGAVRGERSACEVARSQSTPCARACAAERSEATRVSTYRPAGILAPVPVTWSADGLSHRAANALSPGASASVRLCAGGGAVQAASAAANMK